MTSSGWTMTPKHRATYLRECAALIEAVPEEQFDLNYWWLPDGMAFDDDRNLMYRVSKGQCGCAIGHLTQLSRIPGLRFNGSHPVDIAMGGGYSGRQRMFIIAGDAFGIPYQLAEFLFDQYSYSNGQRTGAKAIAAVAKRMRFVADELDALE